MEPRELDIRLFRPLFSTGVTLWSADEGNIGLFRSKTIVMVFVRAVWSHMVGRHDAICASPNTIILQYKIIIEASAGALVILGS